MRLFIAVSQSLTPTLRRAVKDVSKSLGGNERRTRLDLLKKLMQHEQDSYRASKLEENGQKDARKLKSATKLGLFLGEMQVQKWSEAPATIARRPMEKIDENYARTDFFDRGPGLSIFTPVADKLKSPLPLLPVWENLERRRLKQLSAHETRNGFEEMIQWTEDGKMQPYPMDNDYGHVEQNVPFNEHVFLEDQLENGFPKAGPIRHFVELVVHGLSSNPYMSVEKKHGHIAWFRKYFGKRGAEIEKLHSLDLKHQEALAEIDAAAGKENVARVK